MDEAVVVLCVVFGGTVIIILILVAASWFFQRHGNGRHLMYIGKKGIFLVTSIESKDELKEMAAVILGKKTKTAKRKSGMRRERGLFRVS